VFEDLNPSQLSAVTAGHGPLLIIAGAGTGKTKTLATRVAHLIAEGVAPERILLLTFTRRAAAEMLGRAATIAGQRAAGRVWGGTFHACANRLLRLHAPSLGLDPSFTVLDQPDAAELMGLVRADLGLGAGERRFPRKATLLDIYSRVVNAQQPLSQVLAERFPWCGDDADGIRAAFEAYTARKRERSLVDFDDLLLLWAAATRTPVVGEALAATFDHVLVDEYQDTNALQADIVAGLRPGGQGVTVVGDDAQAIYSFRAATAGNILGFPDRFPGTTVVTLEQSYRSTTPILDASNAVMAQATKRFTKDLWSARPGGERPVLVSCGDESSQSDEVCARVLAHREAGVALRSQAVLFRAGHHSDLLELELSRRNIPYVKYGGLKFLEAAHVKDLMALLRVLENPRDELAWFRVLQLLEGVGPGHGRRMLGALLAGETPSVPSAAAADWGRLSSALEECRGGGLSPAAEVERLRAFLDPVLTRAYDNADVRKADLEQLALAASGYRSRSRFVAELTLDPPASTSDLAGPPGLDDDWLVLSTIHSAKGCEWDVVHVIHAADGNIPSDMSTGDSDGIDEERRLLYVAMTRARDHLHVYVPLRYHHQRRGGSDAHSYAQVSRFLVPVRHLFAEEGGGALVIDDVPVAAGAAVATVDAGLAELWSA